MPISKTQKVEVTGPDGTSLVVNPDGSIDTSGGAGGGLTDTELRASPVPVSGSVTATVTGVATAANQTTELTTLAALLAELMLKADLLETQPVSAVGDFPVTASALPLPTGAATETTLQSVVESVESLEVEMKKLRTALSAMALLFENMTVERMN